MIELTFKQFPYLEEKLYVIIDKPNPKATPTLNKLNPYIIDMAPSYYSIGLQLDIVNSKLKLIKSDCSRFPGLEENCRKMLKVWLENDTSATWKKLCGALQEVGMIILLNKKELAELRYS